MKFLKNKSDSLYRNQKFKITQLIYCKHYNFKPSHYLKIANYIIIIKIDKKWKIIPTFKKRTQMKTI